MKYPSISVACARLTLNDRRTADILVVVPGVLLTVAIPLTVVTVKQRRANLRQKARGPNPKTDRNGMMT